MSVMTAFGICMILLIILLLVGVPLPYCFAGALAFMITTCGIPVKSLFVWGYNQMISPSLLAVPMFVIAGNFIAESGIAEKLIGLARLVVGKARGALGVICVIVCGVIGAISGSAFTGIAALGSIIIPELRKEGYSKGFSTALVTCSSILGSLIPPSIPIIIFGWATGTSILASFVSTVVPGIITIITFSAINVFYARKYAKAPVKDDSLPQSGTRQISRGKTILEAIPALMMPVIILGGIYGGIFTATEAAAVCAALAIVFGIFIYRRLKFRNTSKMLRSTASSIGSIFMMIFFCLLLSQVMTQLMIPQKLVEVFVGFTDNKYVVLLMINIFLLFVGMIVNDTTAVMLCAPLLMPLVTSYGISPVHFAAIMIVNLSAGCLTPPYASVLYFGMKVGDCEFSEMMKNAAVFLLVGYLPVVLLTTYIEPVSMMLPRLLGLA